MSTDNKTATPQDDVTLTREVRLTRILLAPVISEKSTRQGERNQAVFRVVKDADKREIKLAVERLFNVQVDSVQVCAVKPKTKRRGQRLGQRQGWKKAYICLKPGQEIHFHTP